MNIRTEAEARVPSLTITPLQPTIGAEISGIDLSEPLAPELRRAIHDAWLKYKVIFFRDQDITRPQHVAFSQNFGEIEINALTELKTSRLGHPEGLPEITRLDTELGPDAPPPLHTANEAWHTDTTYSNDPPIGTILRGLIIPDVGGDTLFADANAMYEGLPEAMKDRIAGLCAVHDIRRGFAGLATPEEMELMLARFPIQEWPLVRIHPETGLKVLNISRIHVSHIIGLDAKEGEELYETLVSQALKPEYQVRFKWRPNSIAFWDDRSTQHTVAQNYTGRWYMERVTIKGRWI